MSFLTKDGLERLWQHIILKLGNKVDKIDGKSLSTEDYTTEEKAKLIGIESGANKTIVDTEINDTSVNPVQNKVIKTYVDNKFSNHNHDISNINELQVLLDEKVPVNRAINGKSLNSDIVLSASDVGADISGSADNALEEAKSYSDTGDAATLEASKVYVDNIIVQKSQVQIITWEDDD